MDFGTSFKICGSGLAAQRAKMDVIISNLANVNTTRTPQGGPYLRKVVVLSSESLENEFGGVLNDAVRNVNVADVVEDKDGLKRIFDPAHPDADKDGYVALPNVNTVVEMTDMIMANRVYEACVAAFDATKNMALKTLELGK